MPKLKSRLTRREEKGLVDIDSIPSSRSDFLLLLLASRILYRIQAKCFQNNGIVRADIIQITQREIERIPLVLKLTEQSIDIDCRNNSVMEYDSVPSKKRTVEYYKQLATTDMPLETMRIMLIDEIAVRQRCGEASYIRRIYKNLITLVDDLINFLTINHRSNNYGKDVSESSTGANNMNEITIESDIDHRVYHRRRSINEHKKCNFRPVYFADSYLLCTEGLDDEELSMAAHVPLLWLPALTNGEEVTQQTASAFVLRRRKGFEEDVVFRTRLQRMNFVQIWSKQKRTKTEDAMDRRGSSGADNSGGRRTTFDNYTNDQPSKRTNEANMNLLNRVFVVDDDEIEDELKYITFNRNKRINADNKSAIHSDGRLPPATMLNLQASYPMLSSQDAARDVRPQYTNRNSNQHVDLSINSEYLSPLNMVAGNMSSNDGNSNALNLFTKSPLLPRFNAYSTQNIQSNRPCHKLNCHYSHRQLCPCVIRFEPMSTESSAH
ncbi:828_t:CDS:1 [Paraglomus brasilianum]|uniref:828_t:CDS:1 n=1 Tax=Paraglomus brasilianum TaxID=144538 RepID=A0A9N9BZZ8_9GLOM|nr:828_t:CDS:1 [Paraglomus brasilianum]